MNNNSSQKTFIYWFLALLIPMLAWAFLNKIWLGRFFLGADNNDFFQWFIYYFKNLLNGILPLWNPYKAWGSLDFIETQNIGVCNPFSLIIPFLLFFGVNAYWAYASYVVIIWAVGFSGFFFLLNRIYRDSCIAWMGTSFLMFSSGLAAFFTWDILVLYIFAPLGWFFGFLIGFVKFSDDANLKRNMFGLCFSSMFIAHLYTPFYFLTLFLTFIISVLFFAKGWIVQFIQACMKSLKLKPWAVLFCLASILFSMWPSIDFYLKMKDPQNISEFFRATNEHKTGNALEISQQMIDIGGLPSRATFSELFSSFESGDEYLSFIPLILYILTLLTLFNRSSNRQRVIFSTGFMLMLIAITNSCPLGHLLYKYLYFFRFFRNYFFFWILFWSCCVVYVMGETKQFLDTPLETTKQKLFYALWVILVHAGVLIYLSSLDNVPVISYLTIFTSASWFLARLWTVLRLRQHVFIIVLVFIGLWQPFYVLPLIRGVDHNDADFDSKMGQFSYVRPFFGSGYNEDTPLMQREKYFQDESGFFKNGYTGQRCSYLLIQNLSKEALAHYVRYKFILYDKTDLISLNSIDWDKVRRVVSYQDDGALIVDKIGLGSSKTTEESKPIILKAPSTDLKVIHFDVNSITLRVSLDHRKFLVYNDSFHPGWHARIDQDPVKIYQANIAFKGIWIDQGPHLVEFYFGSWVDYLRVWGLTLLFLFWLFLVLTQFSYNIQHKDD